MRLVQSPWTPRDLYSRQATPHQVTFLLPRAFDVLQKPIHPTALLKEIQSTLGLAGSRAYRRFQMKDEECRRQ
jgi:hypothetical protein